jgi:hypothetical protein
MFDFTIKHNIIFWRMHFTASSENDVNVDRVLTSFSYRKK